MKKYKTYAEEKGEQVFDWFEALNKKCSEYSIDELLNLKNKAHSWVTCSTGNMCAIIPRKADGTPRDSVLKELGLEFFRCIHTMSFNIQTEAIIIDNAEECRKEAISILIKVEERSQQLIDEEIAKSIKALTTMGYNIQNKDDQEGKEKI